MKNPLIVIEGGDGAGKATQVKMLYGDLATSVPCAVFSFPR